MFHWHYSLKVDELWIEIMAGSYKIEIWYPSELCFSENPLEDFLAAVLADFRNHGPALKKVREGLEKWCVFANPYHRLDVALTGMLERAGSLLDGTRQRPKHPETPEESESFGKAFQPIAEASYEAFGLCRSVRMLLPVIAETFVNLVIYILCKPEIKDDQRLYDSFKRSQIDIRIKSLHLYCMGFTKPIDYGSDTCKALHTIFNSRNDLLHGNINPEADMHELVYFNGTVPLFTEWKDFYERCFAAHLRSDDYKSATMEKATIDSFTQEVIACLTEPVREELKLILETAELGYNPATKRLGRLFPDMLFDYIPVVTDVDGKPPKEGPGGT